MTPSQERAALYAALLEDGLTEEDLNQLIVDKGPGILDAAVPYLVVAARHRRVSAIRRDTRRVWLEGLAATNAARLYPSVLDPAELVAARDEVARIVDALGALDPSYSWPLWWHAAGFSDDEISKLWDEAGLVPPKPSPSSIRKRRERARRQLRAAIDVNDDQSEARPSHERAGA